MKLFNNSVIKQMRSFNRSNLPERATVIHPVTSMVGNFEKTTWATLFTDLPCRLSASQVGPSPGELPVAEALTSRFIWLVVFDTGIVIPPTARITVTGTDPLTGTTWERKLEVKSVSDPRTSSIMTKVYCWELIDG